MVFELSVIGDVPCDSRVTSLQECLRESILEQTVVWVDSKDWVSVGSFNVSQSVILVCEICTCNGDGRVARICQNDREMLIKLLRRIRSNRHACNCNNVLSRCILA